MLNKEQIEKIEGEIKSKNEQITILKKEVRELEDKIIESNIETAKLAFKDINHGDKVRVITQGRDWMTGKVYEHTSDPLFFDKINSGRYWVSTSLSSITVWFFQMKKDGTPSKRTETFSFMDILRIEKVTE